jgi:Transposase DDE domain
MWWCPPRRRTPDDGASCVDAFLSNSEDSLGLPQGCCTQSAGQQPHKEGGWELEVVQRNPGTEGFEVIPKRWIEERTLSWIGQNRRMSKHYERKVQTSETLVEVAMIRLMLRRLARAT